MNVEDFPKQISQNLMMHFLANIPLFQNFRNFGVIFLKTVCGMTYRFRVLHAVQNSIV